ncbi:DUF4177 domain-containing protein [Brevibacillus ruminantium]|uniref:DUF4177 domain-containing protein n=1 Tax=Brevibacillus ruminantium TaxID=2950604 RepID=A0ABY4WNH9_9BACL|nr:DUF4177 domain-containing protein [Brevibacillus ruminantium]USG66964.1 DUF4177 domain-containing protein [Brevibacillus ruminantium]
MEKWEYRSMKVHTGGFLGGKLDVDEFQDMLNKLGAEGWELISCFDTNQSHGASREVITVFKRRKP